MINQRALIDTDPIENIDSGQVHTANPIITTNSGETFIFALQK